MLPEWVDRTGASAAAGVRSPGRARVGVAARAPHSTNAAAIPAARCPFKRLLPIPGDMRITSSVPPANRPASLPPGSCLGAAKQVHCVEMARRPPASRRIVARTDLASSHANPNEAPAARQKAMVSISRSPVQLDCQRGPGGGQPAIPGPPGLPWKPGPYPPG